jgi:hypothetical protein
MNVRAAGAWFATPVGVIALWLFGERFVSTSPGILVGLIVSPYLNHRRGPGLSRVIVGSRHA